MDPSPVMMISQSWFFIKRVVQENGNVYAAQNLRSIRIRQTLCPIFILNRQNLFHRPQLKTHCTHSKHNFQFLTWPLLLNALVHIIFIRNQPFSFVEDDLLRRSLNPEAISTNSLNKNMHILTIQVKNHISSLLTEHFALVIDGWSNNKTHY